MTRLALCGLTASWGVRIHTGSVAFLHVQVWDSCAGDVCCQTAALTVMFDQRLLFLPLRYLLGSVWSDSVSRTDSLVGLWTLCERGVQPC